MSCIRNILPAKFFFVLAVCSTVLPLFARNTSGDSRPVWSQSQNKHTGLYATHNPFVQNGLFIEVDALYYFGDVDNEGGIFNGGFNSDNMSYGGGFTIGYLMPVHNHLNIRYTLFGGTLNGNNKAKFLALKSPRYDFRRFKSVALEPAVGIEYYPFSRAGLYLYAGLGVTASIIYEFEFYYPAKTNGSGTEVLEPTSGSTFGILPMVQLGLGYTWKLNRSWNLSVQLMVQEGLIDTHYMNLDAYPLASSQNSAGVEIGGSFGTYTDRYGKTQLRWNDGWFQLGITVSYRWRNCETCRLINNYHNIKGRR